MIKLTGIGVAGGISVGRARLRQVKKPEIKKQYIKESAKATELERFQKSIHSLCAEIDQIIENYTYTKEDRDILTTHKLILQDPEFIKSIQHLITNELLSLEYAIHQHFSELVDLFHRMENEYFAQRASDYEDVSNRLLHHIRGTDDKIEEGLSESCILIMDDIPPSSVNVVAAKGIRGLCLTKGSKTSHASIIARSLGLVTVVGIDRLLETIKNGDIIILDGTQGQCIVNPDDKTLAYYRDRLIDEEIEREQLRSFQDKNTFTADGKRIDLLNNIEYPEELDIIMKNRTDGVGLFRTEFLFLGRKRLPGEEEQFEIYKRVAQAMEGHKVIIRTMDIGGDKLSAKLNIAKEANPNLGLRGVRLSLRHPEMFKTQLRALLRASAFGDLQIMFPMISGIDEFRQARDLVEQCKRVLRFQGTPFKEELKVGIMVEVPSAVVLADWLAEEADFFSIGTNDLVQYVLAADRDSENVQEYYNPYHPAVIQLLNMVISSGKNKNTPVGICGELASNLQFIPVLIGMGIQSLSVNPSAILAVKRAVNNCNTDKAQQLVQNLLQARTCAQSDQVIKEWHNAT